MNTLYTVKHEGRTYACLHYQKLYAEYCIMNLLMNELGLDKVKSAEIVKEKLKTKKGVNYIFFSTDSKKVRIDD